MLHLAITYTTGTAAGDRVLGCFMLFGGLIVATLIVGVDWLVERYLIPWLRRKAAEHRLEEAQAARMGRERNAN